MRTISLLKLPNVFWRTSEDATVSSILASVHPEDPTPTAPTVDAILGSFSILREDANCSYLLRDRLGLNKLFYKVDSESRTLVVGNYIHDIAERTGSVAGIFSVPSGHVVRIDHATLERRFSRYYTLRRSNPPDDGFDVPAFHASTSSALEAAFAILARTLRGKRVFVCLSGGLDSTVIAYFAQRHIPNVSAVTFSFRMPRSADFAAAQSIAEALRLPFIPVLTDRAFDEARLRDVLLYGQDWRDFNVHCAWVNDIIGECIRHTFPDEDLVFLTGDLMNEYVADYSEVVFKGRVYYPQLRIPKTRRRHYFVFGLEAGDRELGIFGRHGIAAIQPYSVLAEHYLSVPASIIDRPDSKELLNLPLLGGSRLEELVTKKKVRAQVGGDDGGVLGLFHDTGFDQNRLKDEWNDLFGSTTLIQTGHYLSEA